MAEKMRTKKKIRCKLCGSLFLHPDAYVTHLEKKHKDAIPENMNSWQYYYFLKTNRTHGNCVICKSPTTWNEKTHKYNRFCANPKCKDAYRAEFAGRMIGKYGRITLLNDPDQQRKMLENRKISGTYVWSTNPKYTFPYTGSYELAFLEFLDRDMDWDPRDIMAPSPHNYKYTYEGKTHIYFPDFFIPSIDLEVECKDGGDNPNKHPKIVAVDKVKEQLKDEVMRSNQSTFNYLKITNKDHRKFLMFLEMCRIQFEDGETKKICLL